MDTHVVSQLEVAKQSAKAFQGTYDLFRDRLEFGVVSELQTSRAQGDLGAAQARVPGGQSPIAAPADQTSTPLARPPGPLSLDENLGTKMGGRAKTGPVSLEEVTPPLQ